MEEGKSVTLDAKAPNTIEARDVTVAFGEILALDHFTVDVPRGMIGLLGPNGSGKSTFIKTVLGLVKPTGGSVTVNGLDSSVQFMEIRDRVGYMPEHDCLIETMTGIELVSYMGRISGMTKNDSITRGHEVIDFVGLGEHRYRPISTYSTGMKQRVKLAQAIVHDPEIIFLDEPMNGLDPTGRDDMLDLIDRIARSEKSILLSSHILPDIERLCKDVIIISSGRAIVQGDLDDLMSGDRERVRMTIRGPPEKLRSFIDQLSRVCAVLTVAEGFRESIVTVAKVENSSEIFRLAKTEGVQVRSLEPDRISLEDVFLKAVKGVA
ncbi:MAG: ABC transporter ATP-binding protein [Euryarchaeota archaeon]|nr:ABC transporter ATP-binding protein [Euryarchaeota archaeon]